LAVLAGARAVQRVSDCLDYPQSWLGAGVPPCALTCAGEPSDAYCAIALVPAVEDLAQEPKCERRHDRANFDGGMRACTRRWMWPSSAVGVLRRRIGRRCRRDRQRMPELTPTCGEGREGFEQSCAPVRLD
jgi:hypothetical protein